MIRILVDLFVWALEKLSCRETKPVYTTQKTNFEVIKTEQSVAPVIPVVEEEKPVETPAPPPSPIEQPAEQPVEQPVEPDLALVAEPPVKQKRRRKARPTKKKTKKH
jgi:hypothetical protein